MRGAGLLLFVVLCGLEWYFIAVASKSPPYAGPAVPGQKIPTFSASLPDGTPFTQASLADGNPSLLVFFRGRW